MCELSVKRSNNIPFFVCLVICVGLCLSPHHCVSVYCATGNMHHPPSRPRLLLTSECRTTELCTVSILNVCCYLQENISVTKIRLVYVILQNSVPERQLCLALSNAVCLLRVAVRKQSEHFRVGTEDLPSENR